MTHLTYRPNGQNGIQGIGPGGSHCTNTRWGGPTYEDWSL